MELKDVVSVTGMPGLHKVVGQNKSGLILESLTDNKKFGTNARQRVSVLADISIFTDEGEVRLAEALKTIKKLEDDGTTIPTSKSDADEVRTFMIKVLPNYDREKVYPSDMKKLFVWYNMLKGSLNFDSLDNVEETEEAGSENKEIKAKSTDKPKIIATPKTKTPTKTSSGVKVKATTPRKMGS
jgi:Domain of unknown function (DUF5606)